MEKELKFSPSELRERVREWEAKQLTMFITLEAPILKSFPSLADSDDAERLEGLLNEAAKSLKMCYRRIYELKRMNEELTRGALTYAQDLVLEKILTHDCDYNLLCFFSKESVFRLGQMDMRESAVTMLREAAAGTFGVTRAAVSIAADMVEQMEVLHG